MTPHSPTPREAATVEVAAHAMLELVATHPGQFGRLRTARLVAGYAVPINDPLLIASTAPYTSVVLDLPLRDAVALIDALIQGGLVSQSSGMRPTLALTLPGFRALEALADTCAAIPA